jgi:3',5'-cyclic AMP phosphodiesterase CpdA
VSRAPRLAVAAVSAAIGLTTLVAAVPARAEHPRIVAAGDIACRWRPCDSQRGTTRLIERLDPVAVLALGDTQYRYGRLSEYMRSYDATWGRFLPKTYPVPGNHEYNTPNAAGFFRYFGPRTFGGRGYYSFDRGAWHIVALDSVRGKMPAARQLRWLRADLSRNDDRCEVAYFHHPLFTSGTEALPSRFMAAFWEILYRQGVDVILNGHAHNYERFARLTPAGRPSTRGIRQIVVGTGGAGLYAFGDPVPGSQRRVGTHGVLAMRLLPRAYTWRFVAISGRTLDRGRTGCHR